MLKDNKFDTFGIRNGFLAAYSHNLTIFLSFGWPSYKIIVKFRARNSHWCKSRKLKEVYST